MNSLRDPSYEPPGARIQLAALCSRGSSYMWAIVEGAILYTKQDRILQQMLEISCQPLARRGHLSTWSLSQFLFLLKLIDFGIILNGQRNQSSRGVSPTCVIKFVYKLLSQFSSAVSLIKFVFFRHAK